MKLFDVIATFLLVLGGLNLGLDGLIGFNVIESLFGGTGIERFLYILIGLSAIWSFKALKGYVEGYQS